GRHAVRAGPWQDPAGLRELGNPSHVEPDDVHRLVARGEPAHELLALAIGVARQYVLFDRIATSRLSVAACEHLVEVVLLVFVEAEDDAVGYGRTGGDGSEP